MKTDIYFLSYVAQLFLEREMFQTSFVEKIKTHILCLVAFYLENRVTYKIVLEKFCRSEQATDDNMAREQHMLGT